jgi:uncharacterized membrane protein
MCNASETGALSYDKFDGAKDSDKCNLKFTAHHYAGCGMEKKSGITQFFSRLPWLTGICLIIAGTPVCFRGGWVMVNLVSILLLIIFNGTAIIVMSHFGMDSVLEEDNETTARGIFKIACALCVPIIIALAFIVYKMINNKKGEDNGAGTHAGVAGYFLCGFFIRLIEIFFDDVPFLLQLGFYAFYSSGALFALTTIGAPNMPV